MKIVFVLLLSMSTLLGFADSVRSFSADFTQTVTDDTNKTITYSGHVDAARPDKARWDYAKPVAKSVFVEGHRITIVEPELEQAIIKQVDGNIDLFRILSKAQPQGDGIFLAEHESQAFLIKMHDDIPMAISYKDAFENRIRILFAQQKVNRTLPPALFTPQIPEHFDLLTE